MCSVFPNYKVIWIKLNAITEKAEYYSGYFSCVVGTVKNVKTDRKWIDYAKVYY